jgi:hypothetical protein
MTLLEIVQKILSALNGDEVNSIGDTVESLQIVDTVQETYYYIISNVSFKGVSRLIQLESFSDLDKPNYLKLPENVVDIEWIKYKTEKGYSKLIYETPETFLERLERTSGSSQEVTDFSGAIFSIRNDKSPQYWTTFDNRVIWFDSYNIELDHTLQASKSLCKANIIPAFELRDDFIPDLDTHLFPLLLSESKRLCTFNHKQMDSPIDGQRTQRIWTRQQNNDARLRQRSPYRERLNFAKRTLK